jgi:hypothetical protein
MSPTFKSCESDDCHFPKDWSMNAEAVGVTHGKEASTQGGKYTNGCKLS